MTATTGLQLLRAASRQRLVGTWRRAGNGLGLRRGMGFDGSVLTPVLDPGVARQHRSIETAGAGAEPRAGRCCPSKHGERR